MHSYDEPVYMISVVSKVLEVHPQTLRQYEREGLVCPSRSDGKIRLYSQRDIDDIKTILNLTRDLGVNLAGVDVVLNLKRQIQELENEVQSLKERLSKSNEFGAVHSSKAVIPASSRKITIVDENKDAK
ncbi:MAG: heat shock protein transcriptional repressor HspR [Helicobacteraceae bacterium]